MNYFPFHIGDYAAHTGHLEPLEDLAYRRMLDLYYLDETPLPADPNEVARKIRMRANLAEVESVLREFFELTDEGWRHARADEEIDAMRVRQSAQEDKDRHESERMRRYRERRAAMFEALRAVNIVPAWDVPMKELQRLIDTHCNAASNGTATGLQREQGVSGDAPATAISTNTNTNTNTKEEGKAPRKRNAPPMDCPSDVEPTTWADWLTLRTAKKAPVTGTVLDGARKEAGKAGMDLDAFLQVWCLRGSQGLQADWLRPDERQTPSRLSFAERDEMARRRRWEEMTGRQWPADGAPIDLADVIDVAATRTLEIAQ